MASLQSRQAFTASVPLYTGLVALALGARRVELVDARAPVRELAAKLGLQTRAPAEMRELEPAPLVVDITGRPRGLVACLELTAPDGICTSAGGLHSSGRIPLLRAFMRNTTIHIGRSHARALMPAALALIASGKLEPQRVTTLVASIDDAPAALREHCGAGAIKTVLTAS